MKWQEALRPLSHVKTCWTLAACMVTAPVVDSTLVGPGTTAASSAASVVSLFSLLSLHATQCSYSPVVQVLQPFVWLLCRFDSPLCEKLYGCDGPVVQVWQPFVWLLYKCDSPLCDRCACLTALCVALVQVWQPFLWLVQVWQPFVWWLYRCDSCVVQVWQPFMWPLYKCNSLLCHCCAGVTAFCVTVVHVWQPFVWLVQMWLLFVWLLCGFDSSLCYSCTGVTAFCVTAGRCDSFLCDCWKVWQLFMWQLCRCDRPLCDCCAGVTAQSPVSSTSTTPPLCVDKLDNCASYGQQYCSGDYLAWASDNCAGFCKLCDCKRALLLWIICKHFFLVDCQQGHMLALRIRKKARDTTVSAGSSLWRWTYDSAAGTERVKIMTAGMSE